MMRLHVCSLLLSSSLLDYIARLLIMLTVMQACHLPAPNTGNYRLLAYQLSRATLPITMCAAVVDRHFVTKNMNQVLSGQDKLHAS